MGVRLFADAVELQVREAQARLLRLAWRTPGPARSAMPLVAHCTQKYPMSFAYWMAWRKCGESVGSPPENCTLICRRGSMVERVVEDLLHLLPLELVDEADLVRVHEARVAHHVAAVREVDRQHRTAPVLDRRRAVIRGAWSSARGSRARERGARCAAVKAGSIDMTSSMAPCFGHVFFITELAVALFDARADLARLAVDERADVGSARRGSRRALPSRSAGRASRSRAATRAGGTSAPGA